MSRPGSEDGHGTRWTVYQIVYHEMRVEGCEVPIAPAAVHHLVSIAQEAVVNAIHHCGATRILVSLQHESDSLQLSIRDNGCGFHYDKAHVCPGHLGILVMEERARNLGGPLRVNTALGMGRL